jgi:cardiolipin synthase
MNKKVKKRMIITATLIVFHAVGFLSSIHAVMSTRTSQGAIAWAVSLNTFPYVAVPAYWVLGRTRFQGYVTARQTGDLDIQHIVRAVSAETAGLRSTGERTGAARAAELLAEMPTLRGNTVELLIDGDATFASIFEGIEQARKYLLIQFFIVKDDGLGGELKTRLIDKAREGVRIFFLYDEAGSYQLSKNYIEDLREAGVEVFNFHTRKGPRNRFQINLRNHRKIVVADGHTAWVGGHNVGDEYLGKDPKFGHWRDTHLKIEGPAALAVQLSFFEDWHWATDSVPDLNWSPQRISENGADVLVVPTGPADKLETAGLMFIHAINSAQKRIWIASPYFVPDEAVMAALQLAGLRGIDVRILIPDQPDHLLVYLAAFSYFDEARSTGVKLYRYTDGFLHQKTMLVDRNVAAVGTANFDNRSFRLNFEITAFVADEDFASEAEKMFLDDFALSREVQPGDYSDRSFWFKFAVRLSRLTAPIL